MGNERPDRIDRIQAQWHREKPDLDVSAQGVIGRLHRVGDLVRAQLLTVYERYDLGEGEFDVLATLRRSGEPYEMAPGDIARHTMVTSGAVSKRLDRLESAGLVERRSGATDGRSRIVALTARGLATIDELIVLHMQNEDRLLDALTPEQREHLQDALRAWLGALEG